MSGRSNNEKVVGKNLRLDGLFLVTSLGLRPKRLAPDGARWIFLIKCPMCRKILP
jgi:hypothetical protein